MDKSDFEKAKKEEWVQEWTPAYGWRKFRPIGDFRDAREYFDIVKENCSGEPAFRDDGDEFSYEVRGDDGQGGDLRKLRIVAA